MSPVPAEAKRMWLDECVSVGVFDDERSERLWDACCATKSEDPFLEWAKQKEQLR